MNYLDKTKEEIKFNLEVTDNLKSTEAIKSVNCSIPPGTYINKDIFFGVRCIGEHTPIRNNSNIDLTLNWDLEKNNNFNNIIIIWPNDLTKKKNIFFYEIKGLSVKKADFGCLENKFFFYLYVYDLKAEPKISFYLPLSNPKQMKAKCKLHNSTIFICMIDLRFNRLLKGEKIIIFKEDNKYLKNCENNMVLYKVNTNKKNWKFNFQIPVEENCGNLKIVGALKNIGYTYKQVIFIIFSLIVAIVICFFGISFCIVYEIIHRNKKGKYYAHKDEKNLNHPGHINSIKKSDEINQSSQVLNEKK